MTLLSACVQTLKKCWVENRSHPWIVNEHTPWEWWNATLFHSGPNIRAEASHNGHPKKTGGKNETRTNLDLFYNPAVCWISALNTSRCWHPCGPLQPFPPFQSIPDGVSQPNRSSSTWSVWLDRSLMSAREAACEFHTQFGAEFDRDEGAIQAAHELLVTAEGAGSKRTPSYEISSYESKAWG